jgi:hypothetical protein
MRRALALAFMLVSSVAAGDSSVPSQDVALLEGPTPALNDWLTGHSCAQPQVVGKRGAVPGLFREAQVLGCAQDEGTVTVWYLGMRRTDGWYLAALATTFSRSGSRSNVASAEFETQAGPILRVRLQRDESRRGGYTPRCGHGWYRRNDQLLAVCGVGPSGRPSCTPSFAVAHSAQSTVACTHEVMNVGHWTADVTIDGSSLTVSVPKEVNATEVAPERLFSGRRSLRFP